MLAVALTAGAAAVLYTFDPARYVLTPPCAFRTVTGWACPGCGLTRAAHALLHGDVARAFSLNPWAFFSGPALALFFATPRIAPPATSRRVRAVLAWTGLALTLAFWVWRNTSDYPFARVV